MPSKCVVLVLCPRRGQGGEGVKEGNRETTEPQSSIVGLPIGLKDPLPSTHTTYTGVDNKTPKNPVLPKTNTTSTAELHGDISLLYFQWR